MLWGNPQWHSRKHGCHCTPLSLARSSKMQCLYCGHRIWMWQQRGNLPDVVETQLKTVDNTIQLCFLLVVLWFQHRFQHWSDPVIRIISGLFFWFREDSQEMLSLEFYTFFLICPFGNIYGYVSTILITVSTVLVVAMGVIIRLPWAHLNFTQCPNFSNKGVKFELEANILS